MPKADPPCGGMSLVLLCGLVCSLPFCPLAAQRPAPEPPSPGAIAGAEQVVFSRVEAVRAGLEDPKFDMEAALLEAAEIGDLPAVQLLCEHSVDVRAAQPLTRRTALHMAAIGGEVEMLRVLLAEAKRTGVMDACLGSFDLRFRTPLLEAAAGGEVEAVRLLLDHGAEIDVGGRDGRRALHVAVLGGHREIIELLIERGAHVLARDREGRNARQYAEALRRADLAGTLEAAAARQAASPPVRAVRAAVTSFLAAIRAGDLAAVGALSTEPHRALFGDRLEPAEFDAVIEDIEIHDDEARAIVRIVLEDDELPLLFVVELNRGDAWLVERGRLEINDRWEDIR